MASSSRKDHDDDAVDIAAYAGPPSSARDDTPSSIDLNEGDCDAILSDVHSSFSSPASLSLQLSPDNDHRVITICLPLQNIYVY